MKKIIYANFIALVILNSCSTALKPFVPNKTFLEEQPYYLKNNEYDFSIYKKFEKDDIYDKFSNGVATGWDFSFLNSANYPIKNVRVNETSLLNNFNYYLFFPDGWDNTDKNKQNNKFFRAGLNWKKWIYKDKKRSERILKKVLFKETSLKSIKNLQGNIFDAYDQVKLKNSNIFLKIIAEETVHSYRPKNKNKYPSLIILSLNVYDYKFDSLKTYKQIAFFKSPLKGIKKENEYVNKTISSLLGQFSEDIDFLNSLKNLYKGDISEFDKKLIEFKKNEEYKRNLTSSLAISFNLKDYAKALQESNSKYEFNSSLYTISNQIKYNLNDAQTNKEQAAYDAVANGVFNILDDIVRKRDERYLNTDKETVKRMVANYQELNNKQIELINYFSENKYLDLAKFNIDVAKDNSMLSAFQNSINDGAAAVQNQLNKREGITKNDMQQNQNIFSNALNFTPSQNTPETSAITNTSSNAPECNKISETEYKNSIEFKRLNDFQRTGGSLQALGERAKAKLIELTLKNCKTQLTKNEIDVLVDTRAKLIKSAIAAEKTFREMPKMDLKN